MQTRPRNQGLIMTIVIIIIALIVLKFVFDIDVIKYINSGWVKTAFEYIKDVALAIWDAILEKPFTWLWEKLMQATK
jgi:hypothetical protein